MIEVIKKMFGIGPKADFAEMIKAGAIVVDVRTKGEYQSGHIKGSQNIPLDSLMQQLSKFKDKNITIITCCASGVRSASAKRVLISQGFTNVHNGGSWLTLNRKIN